MSTPESAHRLDADVDTLVLHGQLDPAHLPRLEKSKQVAVEVDVSHPTIVAPDLTGTAL